MSDDGMEMVPVDPKGVPAADGGLPCQRDGHNYMALANIGGGAVVMMVCSKCLDQRLLKLPLPMTGGRPSGGVAGRG